MNQNRFWNWFRQNADVITRDYNDDALIKDLDSEVSLSWPALSWEIGPDPSGGWYFALSPNLKREMLKAARAAIGDAPQTPRWKFYATRQRKSWNGRFEVSTSEGRLEIYSSNWRYVLLRYPDGECEIVLIGNEADLLGDTERWQAAAIVVEGMLGEACILDNNLSFALSSTPEPQFVGKEKPVQDLPRAFGLE